MTDFNTAVDFVASALAAHSSTRTIEQFRSVMAQVAQALADGKIANPVYTDIKSVTSRRLDDAKNALDLHSFYHVEMHHVAGRLKKPTISDAERQFLTAILPITEAIGALKPLVFKRQPKPVEDLKAKYLAPRAGAEASAQVQAALLSVTAEAYQSIYEGLLATYREIAKGWFAYAGVPTETSTYSMQYATLRTYLAEKRIRMPAQMILQMIAGDSIEQADVKLTVEATRNADDIRDAFVIKTLTKLDSIVDQKGDFAAIEIVSRNFNMASMEGVFRLSFTDGSEFYCRNSVVWAHSIYGKLFFRCPLTFHTVKLADGSMMSRPSEQRLNEVFIKFGK